MLSNFYKKLICFLVAMVPLTASAIDWVPQKPITVIIAQTPGSGNELIFRKISDIVTRQTGARFIISHHTGMEGVIAWNELNSRAADGHTITVQTLESSLIALPKMYPTQLKSDPNDAIMISILGAAPWVYAVRQDSPIRNVDDLILAFQTKKLNIGVSGATAYLTNKWFVDINKGDHDRVQSIQYRSGPANMADLMAGSLDASLAPAISAKGLAESGKIRIVASTSDLPLVSAVTIPLIKDRVPNFVSKTTWAMFLPKGTPQDVVRWYEKHFVPIISDPEIAAWLNDGWSHRFSPAGRVASDRYLASVRSRLSIPAATYLKPQ